MKIGDKVMVRDSWIETEYMVEQGQIVAIGYYENSSIPFVYLVQFNNYKSHWFVDIALKTE